MVKNGNFTFSTVRAHIRRSTGRSMPHPVEASSGHEWQFYISTVRAHIGRSTSRSTPPVKTSSSQEWKFYISTVRAHIRRSTDRSIPHSVEASGSQNGNFTFLLLELILAVLLTDLSPTQ